MTESNQMQEILATDVEKGMFSPEIGTIQLIVSPPGDYIRFISEAGYTVKKKKTDLISVSVSS